MRLRVQKKQRERLNNVGFVNNSSKSFGQCIYTWYGPDNTKINKQKKRDLIAQRMLDMLMTPLKVMKIYNQCGPENTKKWFERTNIIGYVNYSSQRYW